MAIKVLIFDFDGVIAESVEVKTWAFAELFKGEDPLQVEKILQYHKAHGGISRMVKIRHIYEHILQRPLPLDMFTELCARYAQLVVEQVKNCPFVPGAVEFLKAHYEQFTCYVVSGTPQEEMWDIVQARGLDMFFKGICGSPQTKDKWVAYILAEENCRPGQALVIGDASTDYEAAVANHTHFAARVTPGTEDIFAGLDIKYKLDDLTGLANVIERCTS